ncbi:hypothetical protein L195_g019500 [Trifolium pratense]|uniref:Uncharacterized protein n=1 Tax=Trifolium pratense TaxID=57577 RepID=A0A2K3MZT5_TRIPR|nr:hypothetical protein L195_g019500 [Trifolium pratense]
MCIVTFDFYQGALPNIIKRKLKCGFEVGFLNVEE